MNRYEIEPRPSHLGGGWRLRLLEAETEVGGGVFPIDEDTSSDDAYADALDVGETWLASRPSIQFSCRESLSRDE